MLKNPYVILILLAFVTASYAKGYYAGRSDEKQAQALETARSAQDAKETNDAVRRLPDGAAAIELRKHW